MTSKRALLSVFDKSGVVDLARTLGELGWSLVSSGGTATAIADAGIPVTDVAELTGFAPILGHRVVTLHPVVHAGILADLDQREHVLDLEHMGIEPFGLVVVNLYPFAQQPGIEMIDIGGPAMIRAAAKNYAHVGVVVDPTDYSTILDELRGPGALSIDTRKALARKAFAHTAAYDVAVVKWFDGGSDILPMTLHIAADRVQSLRYGENPHQSGARYRFRGASSWWDTAVQHGGKELSYLNLYDTEAAWRLVHQFTKPAVVIVKHANPCGVALGADIAEAYQRAHACDPVSAFGGIVAANRPISAAMADALAPVFTEVVVAPAFDEGALDVLATKKNLRLLSAVAPVNGSLDIRSLDGGLLVQERDRVSLDRSHWRVVTAAPVPEDLWAEVEMAWLVGAAVSSNAIVLTGAAAAVGIGAGQQNRLDSARIAVDRASGRAAGGVAASDAFFPFRDGLDAVAAAGVKVVIQPGGSVRDDEVIAAADEHGIAMVFTGERHFRH